jgi:hypothetical protein
MSNSLALYTTVYPGAEEFLPAWYASVCAQTDRDFDLWIGADQFSQSQFFHTVGHKFGAHWVAPPQPGTPVAVRQAGIDAILGSEHRYEGIVFIDCDDVMYPTRIETARAQLRTNDAAACAMEIVNRDGGLRNSVFRLPVGAILPDLLARMNAFGMSNTAYRTDLLRQIPATDPHGRLMDWYLATVCWIRGGRLAFDNSPGIQYRQYAENVARVLPPFTPADISRGIDLVLSHYNVVLSRVPNIPVTIKHTLESALAKVQVFRRAVEVPDVCAQYVDRLNRLQPSYLWWEWIAHPSLEELWKS